MGIGMSFGYKPETHNFILLFRGKKINEEKLKKDILKRLTKVKNITIRGKLKLESYEPPKPLGEYLTSSPL